MPLKPAYPASLSPPPPTSCLHSYTLLEIVFKKVTSRRATDELNNSTSENRTPFLPLSSAKSEWPKTNKDTTVLAHTATV